MLVWIVLGLIILLLLLVFITPLRIHIFYERHGEDDQVNLEVTAWFRLIRLRFELPMVRLQTEAKGAKVEAEIKAKVKRKSPFAATESKKVINQRTLKRLAQRFQDLLEKVQDLHQILKWMLKQIRCEQLEWQTTLGLGEAAETGTVIGLAWGLKQIIIAVIAHHLTMRTIPAVRIKPEWNQQILHIRFRCMLRFMVGHAMIAGFRILLNYRKDREHKWSTETVPSK